MENHYEETEVSKHARKRLAEAVNRGLDKELLESTFGPEKRERFSRDGKLDYEAVYESLHSSYQEGDLIIRTIELNLIPEELDEILKFRFRKLYSDCKSQESADFFVNGQYPIWCRDFGIKPDENFRVEISK